MVRIVIERLKLKLYIREVEGGREGKAMNTTTLDNRHPDKSPSDKYRI